MNSSHPVNCPTEYHVLCKALWVPRDSRLSGFWLETASLRRGRCQNREGLTINSGAWHKLESNEHRASGSSGTAAPKCQVAARGRRSSKSQTSSKASLHQRHRQPGRVCRALTGLPQTHHRRLSWFRSNKAGPQTPAGATGRRSWADSISGKDKLEVTLPRRAWTRRHSQYTCEKRSS